MYGFSFSSWTKKLTLGSKSVLGAAKGTPFNMMYNQNRNAIFLVTLLSSHFQATIAWFRGESAGSKRGTKWASVIPWNRNFRFKGELENWIFFDLFIEVEQAIK